MYKRQFLKYPILEKEGLVEHGISTRLGGVSEGFLGSMNLSYTKMCIRDRRHDTGKQPEGDHSWGG